MARDEKDRLSIPESRKTTNAALVYECLVIEIAGKEIILDLPSRDQI